MSDVDTAFVSVTRDLMRKVSDCFKIIQVQQEQQREMNDKMTQAPRRPQCSPSGSVSDEG